MNRINLITLGVKDIKKSISFYRDGLGFECSVDEENPEIVFFNTNGSKLALYPLDGLIKDIGDSSISDKRGFPGITLAYNCKSKDEVDAIFAKIEKIGGIIIKSPQNVFWGGYSGYFTDPDGYYWEVAYADFWKFDNNNMLIL